MNIPRLTQLTDFLDQLPVQKFNFAEIAIEATKPMLEALAARTEFCGTVACAMGWMPAIWPDLIEWVDQYSFFEDRVEKFVVLTSGSHERNFMAAMVLLEIDVDQAYYLFNPSSSGLPASATPQAVAAHIRAFIASAGRHNYVL